MPLAQPLPWRAVTRRSPEQGDLSRPAAWRKHRGGKPGESRRNARATVRAHAPPWTRSIFEDQGSLGRQRTEWTETGRAGSTPVPLAGSATPSGRPPAAPGQTRHGKGSAKGGPNMARAANPEAPPQTAADQERPEERKRRRGMRAKARGVTCASCPTRPRPPAR